MPQKTTPFRAFTLIEILVVVAIIAVLTAILFPVFSMVRERGRVAVCTSNLEQLGLAMQLYVEDNGKYPFWLAPQGVLSTQSHPDMGWGRRIASYVKNREVYRCPSATYRIKPIFYLNHQPVLGDYMGYTTYQLNANVSGIAPAQVRDASKLMVLGDGPNNTSWSVTQRFPTENQYVHHWGKINYWFADGHVKLLSKEQTWWHCKQPAGSEGDKFSACPGSDPGA